MTGISCYFHLFRYKNHQLPLFLLYFETKNWKNIKINEMMI